MCHARTRVAVRTCAAVCLLVIFALSGPAAAQSRVDLQLMLAVDASGSVNQTRFELQRTGYSAAFRNSQVLDAILSGATRSIAVAMVQWTGPQMQVLAVPWTIITDEASAKAFADAIDLAPRQLFGGGTSISGAIDYSAAMMTLSPYQAARRVIDISGDGSNNRGRPASSARDDAVRDGIVINGLPILSLEPDLDRYYLDNVIGGSGSFVVSAASYEVFGSAILKKLIAEIALMERTAPKLP